MATLSRFARRSPLPAVAAFFVQQQFTSCDVAQEPSTEGGKGTSSPLTSAQHDVSATQPLKSAAVPSTVSPAAKPVSELPKTTAPKEGMRPDVEGDFYDLFPQRQLWHPKAPYPLWDHDWDGRRETPTGDKEADRERMRYIRKTGVTRHIILIRHGQYDETHQEDKKRLLTDLGRKQADLTGKRLAEMVQSIDEKSGPCRIKILRVSDMARAKETADIIASHLPDVERAEPDPILNEGRPAHHIPGGKVGSSIVKKVDEQHPRIEEAFRKIFYRAPAPQEFSSGEKPEEEGNKDKEESEAKNDTPEETELKHEFEIIVCHANVIRYFLCRALQLPPETWLRLCTFNCSLTYLTIRPTGTVSCRMLGDIGHLPYEVSTFSKHHGYNW